MADNTGKRRTSRKEEVNLEQLTGTTPPNAMDMEEAVLGALLVEPNCLDDVMDELNTSSCFYNPKNKVVFEAIRSLYTQHSPVDIFTVSEQLKSQGKLEEAGGAGYLVELSQKVGAAAHVEFYTKVVKQKFIQRELITASYEILKTAYDNSVNMEALIDTAQSKIFAAVENNVSKDAQDIGSVINRAMNDLEKLQDQTGSISGVPSGFPTLDGFTLGWQPSDLIILAARPSVGKTALVMNIARNAAVDYNVPVAIFSLEMPSVQLATRMMVSETGFEAKKLKGGKLEPYEWKELEMKIKSLSKAPIYIDSTPSLPVYEFRTKAKRLVSQKNVGLIVVDYLQLMQGPKELRGMREQEVAAISRTLKATAKELNIPIIALSQLSRNAVQRQTSNNKPQLSDLRESGSIEQDADMVLFIHRADYGGLSDNPEDKGKTTLIIAKHRNGSIGEIPLIFRSSEVKFVDESDALINAQYSGGDVSSAINSGYDGDFPQDPSSEF